MDHKITEFTQDVENIQKLGDYPNADNSMTADELKALFDKAPADIKNFLNGVVVPSIRTLEDGALAPEDVQRITAEYVDKNLPEAGYKVVRRSGALAGEPVEMYATSLQILGSSKYLEKVRLPVQTEEASIDISVCLYNSEDMTTPLSRVVVIPDTTDVHYVELPVGRWFAPGEQIIICVRTVAGEWALPQPRVQANFNVDWLFTDLGTSSFSRNEETGEYIFDSNDVQFVGELVFYDTLREEVAKLQEDVQQSGKVSAKIENGVLVIDSIGGSTAKIVDGVLVIT